MFESEYYIQGKDNNTCALIALINALVYYKKPIPARKKLIRMVEKYELCWGSSTQDIDNIAYDLGLYLSPIKIKKDRFIRLLKSKIPILLSGRILLNRSEVSQTNKYKTIEFDIPKHEIISFASKKQVANVAGNSLHIPFGYAITGMHTALITDYDDIDKFEIKNVWGSHLKLDFDRFKFIECDGEKWDSCDIVTTLPLKKTGLPDALLT
jgi:hypothetical protein